MPESNRMQKFAEWVAESNEVYVATGILLDYLERSDTFKNNGVKSHHIDAARLLVSWALHRTVRGRVIDMEEDEQQ